MASKISQVYNLLANINYYLLKIK